MMELPHPLHAQHEAATLYAWAREFVLNQKLTTDREVGRLTQERAAVWSRMARIGMGIE